MPSVVIVGTQYGDEGKGKVVDYYAAQADLVVRFQGGSNVGHTVMAGGRTYKFRMLPSGALWEKKLIIGNGVVVDPERIVAEIKELSTMGKELNLLISERAHVVFPFHKVLDRLEDSIKGPFGAGTTGVGIGPAYADKASRFGIRIADLMDDELLQERLRLLVLFKQGELKGIFDSDEHISGSAILSQCKEFREDIRRYVGDASECVNGALDEGKKVLFEGGQGTLLDLDHGIYPFGTSSNTVSGAACTGTGVGPKRIDRVLGVCKAYVTRVGAGPFPTELRDADGAKLQEKGKEFGTVTGRPRRCGWLDGVALRYSAQVNSLDALIITKIDVLGGMDRILICTGYEYEGKVIRRFPSNAKVLSRCTPIYEAHEAWDDLKEEEWAEICQKGYDALPQTVKHYLKRIGEIAQVPICMISVGPEREATLSLRDAFAGI
jgi:adenylosuccinate synthase